MSQAKKQSFLHGAALLAMATAVVKIIGAFYKIPLKMIIGDQGYGYFITAYDIYTVLLMISTAGLPIAMSRMISQASSLGSYNQVRRIYATARGIFLGLGVVSTALMMVFAHPLAAFQKQPDAWAAIFCLGPCALLMCVMSTYRGFFQGQGDMRPTSNSQIIEAVFKLVVGLALAFAVMKATNNLAYAAGAAILGVTASCLVSAIYLNRQQRPAYRELPVTEAEANAEKFVKRSTIPGTTIAPIAGADVSVNKQTGIVTVTVIEDFSTINITANSTTSTDFTESEPSKSVYNYSIAG